ncbi:MAG: HAD family hydrolase [Pseudomonadota bacterium]
MTERGAARAVTFDFGQTLAELDHDFLAQRARDFGAELDPVAARAATVTAWAAYGANKALGHARAWQEMMREVLRGGSVRPLQGNATPEFTEQVAQALWEAQPARNLWRKPIPGMFELVASLVDHGVPVGIISNSEGRLAELVDELGKSPLFRVVVDSGRLGVDKPDARIFQHAAQALGVPLADIVHVGDAWEADVIGAREAGARAVWFSPTDARALPPGVLACSTAAELSRALQAFGIPAH